MQRLVFQFRVDIEHIEHKSCCFETFSHRFSNHRYTMLHLMSGVERSGVERVKLEEELQCIRLGNCHPWQPKQHPSNNKRIPEISRQFVVLILYVRSDACCTFEAQCY